MDHFPVLSTIIVVTLIVGPLAVLAAASIRFGVDSRPGANEPRL